MAIHSLHCTAFQILNIYVTNVPEIKTNYIMEYISLQIPHTGILNITGSIYNGPTNALVCNKTLIQMSHTKTLKSLQHVSIIR
jgi:hypothetical protein